MANLPHEYTLTLRAREAFEQQHRNHGGDVNVDQELVQERFLLHQDADMIIFASELDLLNLGQSEFIIADGTFEMVPNMFSQLYTIHGFKRGEGIYMQYFQ